MGSKNLVDTLNSLKAGESVLFEPAQLIGPCIMVLVAFDEGDKRIVWRANMDSKDFTRNITKVVEKGLAVVRDGELAKCCGPCDCPACSGDSCEDDIEEHDTVLEIKKHLTPGLCKLFDSVVDCVDVRGTEQEISTGYQMLALGMLQGFYVGLSDVLGIEGASDLSMRLEMTDIKRDEARKSMDSLCDYADGRRRSNP